MHVQYGNNFWDSLYFRGVFGVEKSALDFTLQKTDLKRGWSKSALSSSLFPFLLSPPTFPYHFGFFLLFVGILQSNQQL
jgi:hypothetical protein